MTSLTGPAKKCANSRLGCSFRLSKVPTFSAEKVDNGKNGRGGGDNERTHPLQAVYPSYPQGRQMAGVGGRPLDLWNTSAHSFAAHFHYLYRP
jgi:hypothetical protein